MKSYLTFLSRNKLYTAIEAFGLAAALGFIILLVAYAKAEFTVGNNVSNADKIYVMGSGDCLGMTLDTPKEFFPSIPEIESWTRMTNGGISGDVLVGDDYYSASSAYIDSTFFQMFDYELTGCNRRAVLTDKNDVIVSETFARKAFGAENAIGKRLRIKDENYTVCGVIEDFGRKDLFRETDIFFSIKRAYDIFQPMDNFGPTQIFLTLKPGADPQAVAGKLLEKCLAYWPNFWSKDASTGTILWGSTLMPLDKTYFSPIERDDLMKTGDKTQVEILLLVAFILLVSACFNYVNLTVALTGKRAKEMTMRRVLGEQAWRVFFRYFVEALLFASGCFVLGVFVAYLFRPLFEEWLATSIPISPDLATIGLAIVVLVLLSLVCSVLPAALVLQFKPLDIVKGAFQFRNKMVFSRVFIVVQNVISMVLIAVSVTMAMQVHHLLTLPFGYQTDRLIYIWSGHIGTASERQNLLRQRLLSLPQVEAVGRGSNFPFYNSFNGLTDSPGKTSWLKYSCMDSTAFRLLGFKVVERFADPSDGMCYLDREAGRRYRISASQPTLFGAVPDQTGNVSMEPRYQVCGIIENYRSGTANSVHRNEDAHNMIQLQLAPDKGSWVQIVKVKGDRGEALAAVKKTCAEVARQTIGYPKEMECSYIDDILKDELSEERHTMQLVFCFMFLSILISALGLFAMSVNYSEQRSKETAIRKIMGASVGEAVWKLSRRFIILSLISVIIAVPLCVEEMRYYLQDFYYQIDFPWLVIPLSACITLLITVLSILGQALGIATKNPVESIKTE